MRKTTFHKQTSFTYQQVIASARSAVLKPQDYRLQSNLHSHEEKMKSTVQVLHAKGLNRKTGALFHRTELNNHSLLSEWVFLSVRSKQKYIVYDISVSRGYSTSCQFRSAQQQNTI